MRRRALCALLIWFSKATKQLCSVILFCFRIGVSLQSMVCNSILLMRKLRHREVKWHGNTDSLSRRDLRINIDQILEAKKFCFGERGHLKEIKLQASTPTSHDCLPWTSKPILYLYSTLKCSMILSHCLHLIICYLVLFMCAHQVYTQEGFLGAEPIAGESLNPTQSP